MQYSGTRGDWGPTEQEPVDDKPLNIVVMFPSISIVQNIGNRAVRNLGAGGAITPPPSDFGQNRSKCA